MRLTALAAASLLGGLFHSAPPTTTTKVYGQGEWRLTVTTDAFTKEARCRIENRNGVHPDVVGVPGGLAFRLGGRGLDTSDAWYKLDDQPARPWRDLRAELVAAGSLAEAERLGNLSGGWTVMPLDRLLAANTIQLYTAQSKHIRKYIIIDATFLIRTTNAIGCRNAR